MFGLYLLFPQRVLFVLLATAGLVFPHLGRAQVEYVDPTIGGVSILLVPTRPTVSLPNSMVRFFPDRNDQLDDQVHSFPLTIISHRLGELFWLKPIDASSDPQSWKSPSAYDQEKTTPYYYSTRFDDSLIQTEFTPAERCGYFRFHFPSGNGGVLLANRLEGELDPRGDTVITGVEKFKDMAAYVYGEFSEPVSFKAETVNDHAGFAVLTKPGQKTLEFRYGISFISVEQAQKNLRHEIPAWNFDQLKAEAKDRWNQTLGQIKVEGGTEAQKRVFYTALYRSFERMINITEDGHYYSGFDHKVHADTRPFYVDCWIWDMFRSLEPLQTLLNPEREGDKIQSYVRMYEQSGWMPKFVAVYGPYPCMNGNHAASWFADAWFKGVRNFDVKEAFEGVRKNSLEETHLPWRVGPKCALDDFYNEKGYFPSLDRGETETEPMVDPGERRQSVAVTLENSFDDWNIAQLARAVDRPADYDLFIKRASDYKNLFRADNGFFWPKDARGEWVVPFDPKIDGGRGGRDYYDENNGYTYNWDVMHDYDGLIALLGGREQAEARLDQLFREGLGMTKPEFWHHFADSTGMVGQFSMGNEPSFSIPFIYDRLGAPWKTQKRVRMLIDSFFTDTLQGIPGDEDGGAMSSYAVFCMMGIYPVTPGIPTYDIGSPVFDTVTIQLHNGKTIRITAHDTSGDNKYIQSILLNGKPLNRVWFRHADIANGGTLDLVMGNTPNRRLGSDPKDSPPASISVDPQDFVHAAP
jgi:predicted alpha-1,2-mannosidase